MIKHWLRAIHIDSRWTPFVLLAVLGLECVAYFSQFHDMGIVAAIKAALKSAPLQLALFAALLWQLPGLISLFGFKFASKRRVMANVSIFILVFALVGELSLRLIYHDGESFSQGGLISDQFYGDIKLNKYDRSRGPQIDEAVGTAASPKLHVMVQGDSFTWGQGVRRVDDIYTTQLLGRLREQYPWAEMAVLAKRGREIDGQIEQLRKWGAEIAPDLIIYQWHITDVEQSGVPRPSAMAAPWSLLFFNKTLLAHSYLWFFLDHQARLLLPSPSRSYKDYIRESYLPQTPGWQTFIDKFGRWAVLAKTFTPNIIIFLPAQATDKGIEDAFVRVAKKFGFTVFRGGDITQRYPSSPFDPHPGRAAHKIFADRLYELTSDMLSLPKPLQPR